MGWIKEEFVTTCAPRQHGTSKGDLIVQLTQGPRFVLRGQEPLQPAHPPRRPEILATPPDIDDKPERPVRRRSSARRESLSQGVGAFNYYDQDKILCSLVDVAELLEAAYRWARTPLLAGLAVDQGLDVATVESGIKETRRALRELARIEGKAISMGADEILSMVSASFVRQSSPGQATGGLSPIQEKAS